jgi:hypothetical protein
VTDPNDIARHGGPDALRKVFDRATTFNGGSTPQRFQLRAFNDIQLSTATAYLVKGFIPDGGLVTVFGPPKCGKSFLVFDLVMHVALGWPYRGRKVKQGSVVYLALEGGNGFRARVAAWRQRQLADHLEPVPFYLIDVPIDLIADIAALIAAIKVQLGGQRPVAIVIDTLNRALVGAENDSKDMARFIRATDLLRAEFTCAAILVHHSGLEPGRPRGSTVLPGADDAQISVVRDHGQNIVATVEHMKEGPPGAVIVSGLEEVDLGLDDDGDPITSLVVVPIERGASMSAKLLTKPSKAAQIAARALTEALLECGVLAPASSEIPVGTKVVTFDQWRGEAYRRGISGSDEPRARQLAFARASEFLIRTQQVGVWGKHVWLVQQ